MRPSPRLLVPALLLALSACPEVEPAPPDAATGRCAGPADCAPGPCESASCEQGTCLYFGVADATPCSDGAASGLCHAATCRTEVRLTRAVCVVADFADNVLENYSGPGFASVDEIRASLDEMERHWWWMSQGTHRFVWSVERVTLDQDLSAAAFADWVAFRDEAVRKSLEQIDFDHFDGDGDGLLDAMYIVVANGQLEADWLSGGMSRHRGVNVFTDTQSGLSVIERAYGNFNHEVGHCLGLPDLYGPFGTIFYLSLMHDSWPKPANGFSIYDKQRLGWFAPTRIDQTTAGVELLPAEQYFSGLRIDTPEPSEYFLVEYRRRAEQGYGSTAPAYDGLAIYHVLEASTQQLDPPLLKLEPADGAIEADHAPQPRDLWSPENGAGSFVGRSYLGGGDLFRIENLARSERGLIFDVVMLGGTLAPGPELLANGSFEAGSAGPASWATDAWSHIDETFGWDDAIAHGGSRSGRLAIGQPNDARWIQQVDGLTPGAGYLLCGWLRGENVVGDANHTTGVNLCQMGTWDHSPGPFGSFDWSRQCVAFRSETASALVGCRLGFYYSPVIGTAWCDDLSLVALGSAF